MIKDIKNRNIIKYSNSLDLNTSKYNPYKLINSAYFISNKPKGTFSPEDILKNKDILILGSGKNLLNNCKKIEKLLRKRNYL